MMITRQPMREPVNIAGVPFVQLMKGYRTSIHADTIPNPEKCYKVFCGRGPVV